MGKCKWFQPRRETSPISVDDNTSTNNEKTQNQIKSNTVNSTRRHLSQGDTSKCKTPTPVNEDIDSVKLSQ